MVPPEIEIRDYFLRRRIFPDIGPYITANGNQSMPYAVYKLTHLLGIFVLLMTLALPFMHMLRGGTRADFPRRRTLALTHGAASFLVLLGGFGMLARLGIVQGGLPNWILVKLTIWLVLSAALAVALRTTAGARAVLIGTPLLALLAAAIAIYKPF